MKTKLLFVCLLISSSFFAQSKSDYTGTWEIIVKRSSGKDYKTPSQYVIFNDDGSYIWGIDSTSADQLQSVSKGIWDVTDNGVKIIPSNNPNNEITYYRKSGDDILKWDSQEINGLKSKIMLEMSIYLQRKK